MKELFVKCKVLHKCTRIKIEERGPALVQCLLQLTQFFII